MVDIIQRCEEIMEKHSSVLEERLSVRGRIEVLKEVKVEHYELGTINRLGGAICSETEIITVYPVNIWFNHCGLLPEPDNWAIFEEEAARVLAHEMRHLWQLRNGTFYDEKAEEDADEFASRYIKTCN